MVIVNQLMSAFKNQSCTYTCGCMCVESDEKDA